MRLFLLRWRLARRVKSSSRRAVHCLSWRRHYPPLNDRLSHQTVAKSPQLQMQKCPGTFVKYRGIPMHTMFF